MAGGRGTRMSLSGEKLLLKYKKPVILHVVDSLKDSKLFSKVLAATSNNSPKTKKLLEKNNIEIFHTTGTGYVKDLNSALKNIEEYVFVTSGDLALLDAEIVQRIVDEFDPQKIWTSVLISSKFLATLGLESSSPVNVDGKRYYYTGISMVNAKKISLLEKVVENYIIIDDKRIAFNLNSKRDFDLLGTA